MSNPADAARPEEPRVGRPYIAADYGIPEDEEGLQVVPIQ